MPLLSKFYPAPAEWLPKFPRETLDEIALVDVPSKQGKIYECPDFEMKVTVDVHNFFAAELYSRIREANARGEKLTVILPSPENAVFIGLAEALNRASVPAKCLNVYFLYEYANEKGEVAPADSAYSRSGHFMKYFYEKLDPALRPELKNVHFFTTENVNNYSEMIEKDGGADVAFTALSWSGGIGAIDAESFKADSLDELKAAGSRVVTPMPECTAFDSMRGMFGCAGDIGNVPPRAATVGMRDIVSAKSRFDVEYLSNCSGTPSYQRFPVRLALFGPVCPQNPASVLRTLPGIMVLSENVAKAGVYRGDIPWLDEEVRRIREKEGM